MALRLALAGSVDPGRPVREVMSERAGADTRFVADLVEKRWSRYGKDRVYVTTADGISIGHVDLQTRSVVVTHAEFEAALHDCLERWSPCDGPSDLRETCGLGSSGVIAGPWAPPERLGTRPNEVAAPLLPPPPSAMPNDTPAASRLLPPIDTPSVPEAACSPTPPLPGSRDLADNVAGAAARAKRNEVNAQAPVLNLVARAFGVKTDERNWRVGTKGEVKVGRQLEKLGDGWHHIHAVPVGENGSDIDHVVIGPAGVFTLNTKCHPDAKAWVGERAVLINGHKTEYLRNSRYEADRSRRLLSDACGFHVPVTPVIVFVDLDSFKVKQMPPDVYVTYRRQVVAWLRSLPHTLDTGTVEMIFAKARLTTTWQPAEG